MGQIDLTTQETVDTSNDNIVIVDNISCIRGGRALDVTNWTKTTIPAGHPIILSTSGEYQPIPLQEDGITIDETDADKTVGYSLATVLTTKAAVSIMDIGVVNPEAAIYAIPDACKAATPLIKFRAD